MLGKLFRYHFRSVASYYMPIFIAIGGCSVLLIVSGLISRSTSYDSPMLSILQVLSSLAFVLMMLALVIGSSLIMAYYFYRKYVCAEAYLTMTLPAKPWQHVTALMLAGAVWQIFSFIVCVLSVMAIGFTLIGTDAIMEFFRSIFSDSFSFRIFWNSIVDDLDLDVMSLVILIFSLVISLCSTSLVYYFCLSVGQMVKKHKILAAIAVFVILDMVLATFADGGGVLFQVESSNALLMISTGKSLVTGIVCFIGTAWLLKHKLNLE